MSAPDKNGWCPIETAPKDRLLLLFTPSGAGRVICTGEYSQDWRSWLSVPGGWPRTPTHWQPLPKHPVRQS